MEEMMMEQAAPVQMPEGYDREVFERVWRRVMPDGEQSPVRVNRPEEPEDHRLMGLMPVEPETMAPDREQGVTCLGGNCAVYAPMLRELAEGEQENWRIYQTLARRSAGSAARVLGSLAADGRRNAKRLATACFLITGERWQPQLRNNGRPVPELMNALREQFIDQQRQGAAYQGAAEETTDPCLRQLYEELAQEKELHTRVIRSLLEQI